MKKPNLTALAKNARTSLVKHSPEILAGIGIAGMITTTVLAVKATPKALKILEEEKKVTKQDKIPAKDVVKLTWKCYLPAVATGAASVACLVGASSAHLRRNAALATAYKLSETAFAEYKSSVVETIGEKKEKAIKEKVADKQMEKNPASKNEVFVTSKGGTTLCYDPLSGRYFKSSIEKIQRAVNDLNRQMLTAMFGYISVNDFYDEIGLDHTVVGDDLGWNVDKGLIDISFTTRIADNDEPAIVLDYLVEPKYGYSFT